MRDGKAVPPLVKKYGAPQKAAVFASPESAKTHFQQAESVDKKIGVDDIIPFYTYGLDWISPTILQGLEPSGPEHGTIDYRQTDDKF